MNRQLVHWGGMGSTFLWAEMKKVQSDFSCRSDVMLDPDLSRFPKQEEIARFQSRSSFVMNSDRTVEENLLAYEYFVRKTDRCVTWGKVFIDQFFSRNKIGNLVFLVRHPLHMYISLFMRKHPKFAKPFVGGIQSVMCVEKFTLLWNRLVFEGFATKASFIRFEYAFEDFKRCDIGWLEPAMSKWDSSKRNNGILLPEFEEVLREKTRLLYDELYLKWDV